MKKLLLTSLILFVGLSAIAQDKKEGLKKISSGQENLSSIINESVKESLKGLESLKALSSLEMMTDMNQITMDMSDFDLDFDHEMGGDFNFDFNIDFNHEMNFDFDFDHAMDFDFDCSGFDFDFDCTDFDWGEHDNDN